MSAIAGLIHWDGCPVDPAEMERMLERLDHRGPDGRGIICDASVGFGHQMLRTTPESLQEKLPRHDPVRGLTITADVRLDNRDELMQTLGLKPDRKMTVSDSELVLLAYDRWGEDCLGRLLGDFAFAIWDARRHRLFCARDPMGVRPLVYFHDGCRFAFATEIKALLCLPDVPHRLNEMRVAGDMVSLSEDRGATFYQDIKRLPEGHFMTVSDTGKQLRQYWTLDPQREIRMKTDAEYAEAFREIFEQAVRCRLRSAYTVGAELSGGLDSSAVVSMAQMIRNRSSGEPLHTFTAAFDDGPKYDEQQYVQAVIEHTGCQPHIVNCKDLLRSDDLERALWHQDEPWAPATMLISWGLYRHAHANNNRVLLDGIDGDSTVCHGVELLAEHLRNGRWRRLLDDARGLGKNFNRSTWSFLKGSALRPVTPQAVHQAWRLLHGRDRYDWREGSFINPEFCRRIGLVQRVQDVLKQQAGYGRTLRGSHWLKLVSGMIADNLEMRDRAAGAFGIELRHPFCDRRLVEFCLALPAEQKLYQGSTRMVMRRALAGVLPDIVRCRGDKSLLSPTLLQTAPSLAQTFFDRGGDNPFDIGSKYLDIEAVNRIFHRYKADGDATAAGALWDILPLVVWLHSTRLAA